MPLTAQAQVAPADEAELVRRFGPRVWAYGLRHLRDEQMAADLVQQVLLIVLEALRANRVREPEQLGSFVLGTCRRVVSDQRRTAARRSELLERFLEDLLGEVAPPPDSAPSWGLYYCLRGISNRARRVLHMTFYEDCSGDEIASALSLTTENVRVLRHRSLAQLRACLEARRTGKAP